MSVELAAYVVAADGTVTQELSDVSISGPPRLLQRVAVELLTEKDSVPYLEGRGVAFLTHLRGRAATETDVFAAFAASLAGLRRNLQSEETDADPDDERFEDARAGSIVVGAGEVFLRVSVTNKAGSKFQLVLPVRTRT